MIKSDAASDEKLRLIKIQIFCIEPGLNYFCACFIFQGPSTRRKSRRRRKGWLMRSCVFLPLLHSLLVGAVTHKEKMSHVGSSWWMCSLCSLTAAARQSDWDGIVACHRGRLATTTWSYQRCTMGAHHLQPPAVRRDSIATVMSTSKLCFSSHQSLWSSHDIPVSVARLLTSLPAAILLLLAHHAVALMFTICSLACTGVAMATMTRVSSLGSECVDPFCDFLCC